MQNRPLSPHLGIYRFMYTMALSILHRITGLWMALGLAALVGWLCSAAAGESDYARATALLGSAFGRILLLLWLAAFCYHFCNGLRHLAWDAGLGFERRAARISGRIVLAAALIGFLAAAYLLFCPHAGSP
jgi:succinate dehydrogenase / fumarate reductase, cytochrome b subunit